MADLWQAYGGWVLYAVFFAAFIWLHMRMHGGGGHGCGHSGHSGADQSGRQHGNGDQANDVPATAAHAHDHCGGAGHRNQAT